MFTVIKLDLSAITDIQHPYVCEIVCYLWDPSIYRRYLFVYKNIQY